MAQWQAGADGSLIRALDQSGGWGLGLVRLKDHTAHICHSICPDPALPDKEDAQAAKRTSDMAPRNPSLPICTPVALFLPLSVSFPLTSPAFLLPLSLPLSLCVSLSLVPSRSLKHTPSLSFFLNRAHSFVSFNTHSWVNVAKEKQVLLLKFHSMSADSRR